KQASKTLLVKADPYLADIEYVSWTQNVGTETAKDKLYEGDTTAEMVVKCYDQYTNEYVLTDADITTGSTYSNRIQILSSNGDVLSAGAVTVVGGKLMFEAGDQGTAMFTFIIPDRAVVVSSPMITVYALPVLTSVSDFVVVGATDANGQVIAGEANTVTAVGKDQYLEVTDFTSEDAFTFSTTNETILEPDGISVGENKFTVTPDASGKVTVFVFLNNVLQGQFDLSVVAAAAPRYISMVDAPTAMETGVYRVILSGGITVVDQYGRIMEDPFNETWSYEIQASTTEEHVALYTDHDAYILDTDELTAGTDTFTALLTKDDVIQEESGYSFSVRHVAPSEIVSFTADVVDDVLFSDYDYWNTYYQQYLYSIQGFAPEFLFDEDDWNLDEWFFDEFHSAPEWLFTEFNPYSSQLVILGVTADGTEVELLLDEDFIPEDVDLITFSMDEVSLTEWPMRYDEGAFELHEGPSTWKPTIIASGAAVGTCTVKVWVNGVDVASDTVEVMKEVPDVASITAEINEIDGSTVNVYDYWTLPYDFFGFMIAEYMDDYDMDDFIDWLEFSYGDEMGYELDNLYIIFMITLFDVEDQYGVDLARFAAMMEYRLRFTYSYYRETDDSITTYFTLMTPEGTVWDTVKVTNAEDLLFKLIDALDYLR
ncbi:MAG TPA: hypothetical protein PLP30_11155, partial [Clostridia bacterium]|nr:hypothetical protein [Clostridia bacterium]